MAAGSDAAAADVPELLAALSRTCRDGNHWCFDSDFLKCCGLKDEDLHAIVKRWWGPQEPWLDMLTTEVGLSLGMQLDLTSELGSDWTAAVSQWLDNSFTAASELPNSKPPSRAVLAQRTKPLATKVLCRVRGLEPPAEAPKPAKPVMTRSAIRQSVARPRASTIQTLDCDVCHRAFSHKLGKCPTCFPPERKSSCAIADGKSQEEIRKATLTKWRGLQPAPVADDDWSKIQGYLHVSGGTGGVGLIQRPQGIVAVKRCLPEELFAQRFAQAMGLRSPEMRVLEYFSKEGDALRSWCRSATMPVHEDTMAMRKVLKHDFLCIMEFVTGVGMMGMDAHNFLKEVREGGGSASSDKDRKSVWYELGRLMGFDMLVNNFDRLPLAWTNGGNLGNVMLGSSVGVVVGIDQAANAITHPDGLATYLRRIKQALRETVDGVGPAFKSVQEAVFNNTAIELSSEEIKEMREGVRHFATEAVQQERLERALTTASGEVSKCFGQSMEAPKVIQTISFMVREVVEGMRTELVASVSL